MLKYICLLFIISLHSILPTSFKDTHSYHGIIEDNGREGDVVTLDHGIEVKDTRSLHGNICGYTVFLKGHDNVIPFVIHVTDKVKGQARLEVAKGYKLNEVAKRKYKFEIEARPCDYDDHRHVREVVNVEIVKTATDQKGAFPSALEHASTAGEESTKDAPIRVRYADLEEGVVRDLMTLSRARGDCEFTINRHHDDDEPMPFAVNNQGVVSVTSPLFVASAPGGGYEFSVSVWSCGQKRLRHIVEVKVNVVKQCVPQWKGVVDSRLYYSSSRRLRLFNGHQYLDTCGHQCDAEKDLKVQTTVELDAAHISHGCDRHHNSLAAQRKFCGTSANTVELITDTLQSTVPHDMADSTLPEKEDQDGNGGYRFDGKNTALRIPSERFNHTLGQEFTISTWMLFDNEVNENSRWDIKRKQKSKKYHILCNSDGEAMSRHHYSLFVHNCKLIFLLRREPIPKGTENAEHKMNIFKPAEWRWPLSEVCDDKWHHYAVSVNFPQVTLYVDGVRHAQHEADSASSHRNADDEVVDDWPLHRTRRVRFTRLVLGACWAARAQRVRGHFRGSLAGLTVLTGARERPAVLECITACAESLKMDAAEGGRTSSNTTITTNHENTRITITGKNSRDVSHELSKISYTNTKLYPTHGDREVKITTSVTCSKGMSLVPDQKINIHVKNTNLPVIILTSPGRLYVSDRTVAGLLESDALPFRHLLVDVTTESYELERHTGKKLYSSDEMTLDKCRVNAVDITVDDVFRYDLSVQHYLRKHDITSSIVDHGFEFSGEAPVSVYRHILRNIHYVNKKAAELVEKRVVLTCSKDSRKFVSNRLVVKIIISHELNDFDNAIHAKMIDQPQMNVLNTLEVKGNAVAKGNAAVGTVIIVVVCVGLIGAIVGVVAMRFRTIGRRTDEKQAEMEWDNSSLTITVNPLDQTLPKPDGSDSEDSYDEDDDEEEGFESSEDEAFVATSCSVARHNLEWDDSTLSF